MPKILIVEDEKILAEMYEDKFQAEGFEVKTALSAQEGLEYLQKEKPDLILLDILLPRQNGISFLTTLQKQKELSKIPVIAFSNYDDLKTKQEAYKLGVKEYLIKTQFTPKAIVECVKSYLK